MTEQPKRKVIRGERRPDLAGYAVAPTKPKPWTWYAPGYEEEPRTIEEMPNYERLTRGERRLMNYLPGFAQGPIGKALEYVNGSWLGRNLLPYLDVLAEGTERLGGLAAQAAGVYAGTPEEIGPRWEDFSQNLGAAWYAGSLSADMANLPTFRDGRFYFPEDLGGIDGIVRARQTIVQLTSQGVPLKDALAQVREQYYSGLGALAIRGQVQDALFHIVADPLNILLPFLRPVERVALSKIGLAGDKAVTEAFKVEHLAELATKLDEARLANRLEDVADIEQSIGFFSKVDTLTPGMERVAKLLGIVPMEGKGALARFLRSKWNPIGLTPASRAVEFGNIVADRIISQVVGRFDSPDEIIRVVRRVASGLQTPELGHMILTAEGRSVRAMIQHSLAKIEQHANAFDMTTFERTLFERLAAVVGEDDPVRLFVRVINNEERAVMGQVTDGIGRMGADVAREIEGLMATRGLTLADLTPDFLRAQAEVFGDYRVLNSDIFKAAVINEIMDVSAQHGLVQFGVKAKGFLAHMSDAFKKYETLAFLRINPSYAIRNFFNNEFTAIARGSFSLLSREMIEDFWGKMGFQPPRLWSGFGAAEIPAHLKQIPGGGAAMGVQALNVLEAQVEEASRGTTGWLNRMSAWARKINLGSFDMGQWAARHEANASARMSTIGTMRGMHHFWYPPEIPAQLVAEIGEAPARAWIAALKGVRNDAEIAEVFADASRVTVGAIMDRASRELGTDLGQIVSPEAATQYAERLSEAVRSGGGKAVRETAEAIRGELRQFIQNSLGEEEALRLAELTARVETEGPLGMASIVGDAFDNFQGAHARWDLDAARLAEQARAAEAAGTKGLVGLAWRELEAQRVPFWKNEWNRFDTNLEAIRKGLKRIAAQMGPMPDMDAAFNKLSRWRTDWTGFFKSKGDTLAEFFEAVKAGKPARKYEVIAEEISQRYAQLAGQEDLILSELDAALGRMVPEGQRPLWMAWRDASRRLRIADREAVIRFRDNPFGDGRPLYMYSREDMQLAYQNERIARMARLQTMVANERRGVAALAGDPQAGMAYAAAAARHTQVTGGGVVNALRGAQDAFEVEIVDKLEGAGEFALARIRWAERTESGRIPFQISETLMQQDPETVRRVLLHEVGHVLPEIRPGDEWQSLFGGDLEKIADAVAQYTIDPEVLRGASPDVYAYIQRVVGEEADVKRVLDALTPYRDTVQFAGIPRLGALVGDQMWRGEGMDRLFYERGDSVIDALRDAALAEMDEPARALPLTEGGRAMLGEYVASTKAALSTAKYNAVRFGEWVRDAGLLNYTRRMNFNAWLDVWFPYEFWTTTSIYKWALHSIDRPAMLATYLRMQKFLATAYRPEPNLPQRLQGKVRIPLPFLPSWMGDSIFVDPLGSALPFKQWEIPLQAITDQKLGDAAATRRVLEELLNDGKIEQGDYDQALRDQTGPTWERAMALARQDDADERQNPFDIASLLTSPHAPLVWAYNALRGQPQDTGPFLPITRTIKGATALLGIGPPGGVNIEGSVRRALGLPAFDQWDDYRVDRMISNMIAMGEVSVTDGRRAMSERAGPIFEEAKRKAGIEFGVGAMGSLIGMPAGAYPEGEERLRELRDAYQAAWKRYEAGNLDAVNAFYREHPEYEARLALFKKPEERLRQFLVDELWTRWNEMPKLHKDELRDQLGDLFQTAFLSRETRSYDAISTDMLGVWLKYAGGQPPGNMTMAKNVAPIDYSNPDIAWRLQAFYDTRNQTFRYSDVIWDLQSDYFKLDRGGARRAFIAKNPVLAEYWNWRRDFMERNPDLAPYLEDDPAKLPTYGSQAELERIRQAAPQLTWLEWSNVLGGTTSRLLMDNFRGGPMEAALLQKLGMVGERMGLSPQELMMRLEAAWAAEGQ